MIRNGLIAVILLSSAVVVFAAEGVLGSHFRSCKDDPEVAKRVKQYRAAGEPVDVEDLRAPPVPDQDNAVIELRSAGAMADPDNGKNAAWKQYQNGDLGYPMTAKERRLASQAVSDNAQIAALLDQAMAKKAILWRPRPSSPLIMVQLPELHELRYLALFLHMRSLVDHVDRRDDIVPHEIEREFFVATALDHDTRFLVVALVAGGVRVRGCDSIRKIEPTLSVGKGANSASPEAVGKLIKQLLAMNDQIGRSMRQSLHTERLFDMDAADAIANGHLDVGELGMSGSLAPAKPAELIKSSMIGDLPLTLDFTTQCADAMIARDWPEAKKQMPADLNLGLDATNHLFARTFTPSFSRSIELRFRWGADTAAAATALAIRWYQADHGQQLPPRLNALVPKYLPALQADPFSAHGEPLRYVAGGDDPRVYCLSPDGTDGGGHDRDANGKEIHPLPGKWSTVYHLRPQKRDLTDLPADLKD